MTDAAPPPANPSRAKNAAAVQFGTIAAAPNIMPSELVTLFFALIARCGPFRFEVA